jgi:hypothetical protein
MLINQDTVKTLQGHIEKIQNNIQISVNKNIAQGIEEQNSGMN